MEKEAKKLISEVFEISQDKILNLARFKGGMSNYTYYFMVNEIEYVIRIMGDGAYKYVDFINELNSIVSVEKENLTSKLIYFDVKTGNKISMYSEGHTFNFKTDSLEILVNSLKKMHSIKAYNVNDYDLINRLSKYESYNDFNNIDKEYFKIKTWWLEIYNSKYSNLEKVFCHNDLQTANIISSSNKIEFIDFEYAGYNDIYYDISSIEENALLVFEKYFERKATETDIFHLDFYKIYQALQWYQVALYKDSIGFSKKTNFDFKELTKYFLNLANDLMNKHK